MKAVCILVQSHYEFDIRVRRKAEALVAAGYQVDVLALRMANSQEKVYTLGGVTVHTVGLGKKRGSFFRYLFEYFAFFVWSLFKLHSLMRRRRYQLIDVNTLPDMLIFAGMLARWKGAKLVLDMHEITPEFYISKYGIKENSWVVRGLKFLERVSFNYADRVITINEPIQDLLQRRGLPEGKSIVIMNSVDESLFASVSGNLPARPPADQGKFIMMYHGTLTRIYGMDIAIQALSRVHKEVPHAELWILGGGSEKAGLQTMARELGLEANVKFVGSVLPQDVPQWLSRCHIGILATRQDVFLDYSFSNKLSEYIIMSKAVVISRLRTIRHYFSEESMAFFIPEDPADLAAQILRLYRDPALRERLARRAREEYDPIRWEVMKERYLELVQGLVGAEAALPSPQPREAVTP